ncbi:MAG TPA: MMPL family transporter [Kiloniellaceae bacterium]|nr:MMPL family transporter [Kiloniellaceae bacterium]
MGEARESFASRCIAAWVAFVTRRPAAVLTVALLTALAGLAYGVGTLGINTSTKDMLSEELPFRQNDRAMERAFPDLEEGLVAIVEAESAAVAETAAAKLAEALAARQDAIDEVYYPEDSAFFRRNGLLYLSLSELEDLADRLAEQSSLLARLKADPSLRGLEDVVADAIAYRDRMDPSGLADALDAMTLSVQSLAADAPQPLSWQALMAGNVDEVDEDRRRVLLVRPRLDYGSLTPAKAAETAVREAFAAVAADTLGAPRLRLTGSALMFQDELASLSEGMGLVGLIALAAVTLLLWLGLGSWRAVAALLASLFAGLCWTAAFAALTVGTLNLISVAFAVLFIGLSVDFGIHYLLRSSEALAEGGGPAEALETAARRCGAVLGLCAVSTAIGFYAFLPTSYRGLSELGLISGSAMFIAFVANLTVLPAILALFGMKASPRRSGLSHLVQAVDALARGHAKAVVAGALLLAVATAFALPSLRFDDDPLNLRDPDSPSVAAMLAVMTDSRIQPYAADILLPDLDAAGALAADVNALPEVAESRSLLSLIPANQPDKLAVVDDLNLFLEPVLDAATPLPPPTPEEQAAALQDLIATLETAKAGDSDDALTPAATALAAVLRRLGSPNAAGLALLDRLLLGDLPRRLDLLADSLEAQQVDLAGLPETLSRRWVAADGRARVEVVPAADLRDQAARRAFVEALQAIAPDVIGAPVIIVEAGKAVIEAFVTATAIAFAGIFLLLWLRLRALSDSVLVMVPLVFAGLMTAAVTVLIGLPFNFANIIVLPLLLGLGVDSGIHMVTRGRERRAGGPEGAPAESDATQRAVMLSAFTTIASFGALALSSHTGTASMGQLLTVAIVLGLLATLVVLPALLTLLHRDR